MTTNQVIEFFGSQSNVARKLKIKPPSVSGWGRRPPAMRQLQIEMMTNGRLVADERLKPWLVKRKKQA